MADIKLTLVVACALVDADKRVLIAQRPEGKTLAGLWEFPGGKVEPGETDEEALVRECVEELGVRVRIGARVGDDVPLAHGRAVLRVWLAQLVDGQPQPLEHASLRWLAPEELDEVPWLPADAPIVAELAKILPSL
jgi:8-oxo-dGTP diphosphatase